MRVDNRVPRDRITMWKGGTNVCRVIMEIFSEETPKYEKKLARQIEKKTVFQEEETGCQKTMQREGTLTKIGSPSRGDPRNRYLKYL